MAAEKSGRLMSLDALRGLDMFFLVMFGHWVRPLCKLIDRPWSDFVVAQLQHRPWEGLNFLDMLMPLFLFCAGTAIPFAFAKYREQGRSRGRIYLRIFRRFVLLWILGMINQGDLLSLDPRQFNFYNNTLQAIAIGYTVAAVLFINTKPRVQLAVAASILLGYWAFLSFGSVDGFRGGNFTPEGDLCIILGNKLASALPFKVLPEWLVCWPGFIVTVMSGSFAGQILRGTAPERKKLQDIFGVGMAMLAAGYLLSLQMPVIKTTWNVSFTLVSGGYCFVLLGLFYFFVDYKGWKKCCKWLMPIGMNAIVPYMIWVVVRPRVFTEPLLYGLNRFMTPETYIFIRSLADIVLLYLFLYHLYKRKIFIKI